MKPPLPQLAFLFLFEGHIVSYAEELGQRMIHYFYNYDVHLQLLFSKRY